MKTSPQLTSTHFPPWTTELGHRNEARLVTIVEEPSNEAIIILFAILQRKERTTAVQLAMIPASLAALKDNNLRADVVHLLFYSRSHELLRRRCNSVGTTSLAGSTLRTARCTCRSEKPTANWPGGVICIAAGAAARCSSARTVHAYANGNN